MPHKARPRSWVHFDVDFLNQDTIAELRDEFGAAGPLAILAVVTEAKRADLGGSRPPSEQGTLSIRLSALARLVGTSPETISAIVKRSIFLGLLETLDGTDLDAGRLVVRSLKRAGWEPHDATSAARSARKRQRDGESNGEGSLLF